MRGKRWTGVLLLVVPVLSLIVAFAGFETSFSLMDALGTYRPGLPFEAIGRAADANVAPGSLTGLRSSRRVLLVVVDGLRQDTSEKLGFLNELRSSGSSGTLIVGAPSYSKPGYALHATGADQEVHGIVLNDYKGPTPAESLFSVASKAGLKTAAIADDWWKELVGSTVTYERYYADASFYEPDNDDKAFASAKESLLNEEADLTLVHFGWTDVQAHDYGGAASNEYLKAAQHIDVLIRGLASELDLSRDTIVVTADHGHLGHNLGGGSGHGGWEREVLEVPFVTAGAGIAPGKIPTHAAHDLPPTVAALLGLPAPAHAEGGIMFDALTLDGRRRAGLAVAQAKRMMPFAQAYREKFDPEAGKDPDAALRVKGAEELLLGGDYAAAYDRAVSAALAVRQASKDARAEYVRSSRLARLPVVLAIVLTLAAVLAIYARLRRRAANEAIPSPSLLLLLAGSILYLALDVLIYRAIMGGTYTLGAMTGADPISLMRLFAWPSYVSLAIVALWFWVVARSKERAARIAFVEGAVVSAILGSLAVVIFGLGWTGLSFTRALPDFGFAFIGLVHMLKLTFMVAPALLLVLVAAVLPGIGVPKSARVSAPAR